MIENSTGSYNMLSLKYSLLTVQLWQYESQFASEVSWSVNLDYLQSDKKQSMVFIVTMKSVCYRYQLLYNILPGKFNIIHRYTYLTTTSKCLLPDDTKIRFFVSLLRFFFNLCAVVSVRVLILAKYTKTNK